MPIAAVSRRTPSRPHGEKRRERILAAAAELIASKNFDGLTMSEVARSSGSSLGTLYQYFCDKNEVALTIRVEYGEAFAESWKTFLAAHQSVPLDDLVVGLVQMLVDFTNDHPAYLPLLDIVPQYRRNQQGRKELRVYFGEFIQQLFPHVSQQKGVLVASVVLQITKALLKEMALQGPATNRELQAEFTHALQAYLRTVSLASGSVPQMKG